MIDWKIRREVPYLIEYSDIGETSLAPRLSDGEDIGIITLPYVTCLFQLLFKDHTTEEAPNHEKLLVDMTQ
jgi:hypothetical protein